MGGPTQKKTTLGRGTAELFKVRTDSDEARREGTVDAKTRSEKSLQQGRVRRRLLALRTSGAGTPEDQQTESAYRKTQREREGGKGGGTEKINPLKKKKRGRIKREVRA